MIVKVHSGEHQRIVVICDSELIGKQFSEGNKKLDLTARFYDGEEKTEEELKDILREGDILHVVGEKSIEFCKKHKLINEEHIITIKGVPHAQSI